MKDNGALRHSVGTGAVTWWFSRKAGLIRWPSSEKLGSLRLIEEDMLTSRKGFEVEGGRQYKK